MNSKFLKIGLIFLSLSCSLKIKCETIQVKIFFDKDWKICKSEKAFYHRLCGWNTIDQFFEGEFSDYLSNGTKIVQGNYKHGKKEGEFIFYYESGIERIKGAFKNDIPDSLWSWFYSNKKNELKIFFRENDFDILEVNNEDGNSVLDRKHNFSYKFQNDNSNSKYRITGLIENRLKKGKWKVLKDNDEVGFDFYENNQYSKTVYGSNIKGNLSRIINNTLFVPFSIYACEKLKVDDDVSDADYPFSSRLSQWQPIDSAFGVIGDSVLFQIDSKPKYLGGIDGLNKVVSKKLKLSREYFENCKQFGYAYYELEIDENGDVINKNIIRSPDKIITEIALNALNNLGRFKPAINGGKTIKSKITSRIKFEKPKILY